MTLDTSRFRETKITLTVSGAAFKYDDVKAMLEEAQDTADRDGGKLSVHVDQKIGQESMRSTITVLVRQ